jgi:hypothetical protein
LRYNYFAANRDPFDAQVLTLAAQRIEVALLGKLSTGASNLCVGPKEWR